MTDRSRAKLILGLVAKAWDLPLAALYGPSRRQPVALARQAACWLIRRHTGLSLPAIGEVVNRHHTTVLHAVEMIDVRLRHNPDLMDRLEWVQKQLEEQP